MMFNYTLMIRTVQLAFELLKFEVSPSKYIIVEKNYLFEIFSFYKLDEH